MEEGRKPLGKLNVIDDFLMNELVGSDEYGSTFVEYFLQVVLGQKIEVKDITVQRVTTAGDTEKRGIRLDIRTRFSLDQALFDLGRRNIGNQTEKVHDALANIEMQANSGETGPGQKYDIRRRSRLYQAIMDSSTLKTGSEFGDLGDILVIICASFDVFGYNRAKYTFTHRCRRQ